MAIKSTDIDLNTEILHDLLSKGIPKKEIATELGISVNSLNKSIAELQSGQGLLLKYRELQGLQLTGIQAKILDAITPEKIEAASLVELVSAFKVLKDKELVMGGKANNITGIVGYLVQLEKEEQMGKVITIDPEYEDAIAELCSESIIEIESDLPRL